MKQVVIVAPHFPPSNLTAGHRARYFAAHLPALGWTVRLLTVAPEFYEERLDPELEALVAPDIEVIRTPALPTRPVRLVGDLGMRAFWHHYRAIAKMARAGQIDLLYIPIPPNFIALLGPLVQRRFGIPYAIDYIDPWVHHWTQSEIRWSKAWFAYHLGRLLEPVVLRRVSLVTAVAPGYYEGPLRRYPWLDPARCLAMPYGAHEPDHRYVDDHPRPPDLWDAADGKLHVVYAGAMLPKAFSTLEALLQALLRLREQEPETARRFRFHFVGTGHTPNDPTSYLIRPVVERYGLLDQVTEHAARIPYLSVLNHLKHAHAVLVMGSSEPHYTPSKVFQAVLSHRPVFALLHARSTAVEILAQARAGLTITFDEAEPASTKVEAISHALHQLATLAYSPAQVDWQRFAAYSTEAMSRQLAEAFDSILATSGREMTKRQATAEPPYQNRHR